MGNIHSLAVVSDGAQIGQGTEIGPFTYVGPNVKIGENNKIASNVVIDGKTTIGDNNQIFQFASIGAVPQDLKYAGEDSELIIGNGNKIRECVTMHKGTKTGIMKTVVGNNNLFMACTHIAHDVVIGNSNVFANCATLAGHVSIANNVIMGGLSAVHQFTRIGEKAFVGGGAMVTRDIAPCCYAQGDRAGLVGINQIGLLRSGMSKEDVLKMRKLYRKVFLGEGHFKDRVAALMSDEEYSFEMGKIFLTFLSEDSIRGFTLARKNIDEDMEQS
ncbi:MAG: acyl-ACP--UDP-N-acetylglucosamine O-acyltransferase [Bdellovibrionota bacterium]